MILTPSTRLIAALTCWATLFAGPTWAATTVASTELVHLEQRAASDAHAAYALGERLLTGQGIERDPHAALEWLRSAADRGLAVAQRRLGELYLSGLEEMGSDPIEAVQWLTLAADQGDARARSLLPQAVQAREAAQRQWQQQQEQAQAHDQAMQQRWLRLQQDQLLRQHAPLPQPALR